MSNFEIYFDPIQHKYTDNFSNAYTSVTTVIGKFEDKFSNKELDIAKACERIGKNPRHPKYLKYKNKTYLDIIKGWKKEGDIAREIGNVKHDYLETSVKTSTGFYTYFKPVSGRLFTVKDVLNDNSLGRLDLNYFIQTGIKDKYPEIYNVIAGFVNNGWAIYAEICTYSYDLLVSGLIDILLVKNNMFVILDWKTNKTLLHFEAGYYDKDINGNATNFIQTDEKLLYPLNNYPASRGYKYTFQLSTYATLTENHGFECKGLILCHIRHHLYDKKHIKTISNPELLGLNVVDIYPINYLKADSNKMLYEFAKYNNNGQILIK